MQAGCVYTWRGWEEKRYHVCLDSFQMPQFIHKIQTRPVSMTLHTSLSVYLCMCVASSNS
ncbi:hypothetical protein DVA81_19035 [Acinetobacter baumannii]|nr:hypothetical protein DVA81_19035 [Acinetobacter baumannii]